MSDTEGANRGSTPQTSGQISADIARLRDDFAKLSASVADLVKAQAGQASAAMRSAVGDARERLASSTAETRERLAGHAADAQGRIMDKAADAQDRFIAATADLEATIERNPLTAV